FRSLLLMLCSSLIRKLVVDALQSLAQMKHRVALARQQRVDVNTALGRQLLEAAPLQFVSDEYFTRPIRLIGQFVERRFQLIEKHAANVERFRPGIRRRQQVFDPRSVDIFVAKVSKITGGCVAEVLRLLLAKKVRDAISRDPKEPAGYVIDRHQQA